MNKLPLKWSEYKFPRWVPLEVRAELCDFWSEDHGRSPREWDQCVHDAYNKQPQIGSRVTCSASRWNTLGCERVGRWVPMWNSIGRLVTRDKRVFVVSTGDIVKMEEK